MAGAGYRGSKPRIFFNAVPPPAGPSRCTTDDDGVAAVGVDQERGVDARAASRDAERAGHAARRGCGFRQAFAAREDPGAVGGGSELGRLQGGSESEQIPDRRVAAAGRASAGGTLEGVGTPPAAAFLRVTDGAVSTMSSEA